MNMDNTTNGQNDTLKSFLKEEIDGIRTRLGVLKGKIKKEDFDSLEAELNEKSEALESIQDDEDSQFFLLRREIGMLSDSTEALAVKQRWWSKIPAALWVVIILLPVIFYFVWLSFVQWRDQGQIYNYPATQTAVATQATLPGSTAMPTSTSTQIP